MVRNWQRIGDQDKQQRHKQKKKKKERKNMNTLKNLVTSKIQEKVNE